MDTTETTPATPPVPPAPPQENWEARFKGLNKLVEEKQRELAGKEAMFVQTAADRERLAADLKATQDAKAALEAKIVERDKAIQEAQANSAKMEAQNSRLTTIAAKDPSLLALEQKGLLRTDIQGEGFAKYLNDFVDTLKLQGTANIEKFSAGATQAAQPPTATDDPGVLYDQMQAAMRKGDMAAFKTLNDKYIALPAFQGKM